MVDPARVVDLLERLDAEVADLSRTANLATDEVLADRDLLAATKYRLIVAVEICIDVARHLIASDNLRSATDYADAFAVLGEAEVVDQELATRLRKAAGARNLLVHGYMEVDERRVVEDLRRDIDDLLAFRRAMASLVARPD